MHRRLVTLMKSHFGDDAMGRRKAWYFLPWHFAFFHRCVCVCVWVWVWVCTRVCACRERDREKELNVWLCVHVLPLALCVCTGTFVCAHMWYFPPWHFALFHRCVGGCACDIESVCVHGCMRVCVCMTVCVCVLVVV